MVAVNTGLRPGETVALEEKHIDFEKHIINVERTLLYQKLDGDEKKSSILKILKHIQVRELSR